MNFLALIPMRFWAYGALLVALTLGGWRLHHTIDQQGYQRAHDECALATNKANALAEAQRVKDAAAAQVEADAYDRLAITNEKLLKEARHDLFVSTQNLATCKLDTRAVRVLNDASRRAASN